MRNFITLVAVAVAGSASAHPGHLIEAAGHDHWAAGVAIGAAIAISIWGAIKAKDADAESDAEAEPEGEEPAEA